MFKIIHADPRLEQIQELIQQLDSTQFYFIERYCAQERQKRQQDIFNQWLSYLHTIDRNQ